MLAFRWRSSTVGLLLVTLVLGSILGVGSSEPADAQGTTDPGITDTEIRVGGVASVTNPINGPYASSFDGVQAYFDMVNAAGGVHGRKLRLVARRDDKIAANAQEVQGLLEQDKVFAALPMATIFSFSGAKLLAEKNVPAFGWGINAEWTGPENLFQFGGINCFSCTYPAFPMVSKLAGKKKIGVVAYGVANSSDCAEMIVQSYKRYPTAEVVYVSKSLAFGVTDLSAEVKAMKDAGVTMVNHCIDQNGALSLAKEMRKQNLKAIQLLPNAYDHKFMRANAAFLAGSLILVQFAPFEFKPQPTGLKLFNKWMKKKNFERNEISMVGWMSANLFVKGLEAAGRKVTRASLIDVLNTKFTKDTMQGLAPGTQTIKHTTERQNLCIAMVKVAADGAFLPWQTRPRKPFLCWDAETPGVPKATIHR